MAFPSFDGSTPDLYDKVRGGLQNSRDIRNQAISLRDRSLAGNIKASEIKRFHDDLKIKRDELDEVRNTPGVPPVAQEIVGNPGLNLGAEYTALETRINAVLTQIRTDLPNNGSPNFYLLVESYQGDELVSREFTPAQLVNLRTELDLLIAQID